MERRDDKLSTEEIMRIIGVESPSDDTFFFSMMLLLLGVVFPAYNPKLDTEVAELKGKVSVIEDLITR